MEATTFELSTNKMLQGLAELRDQRLLCDVHLVAEDERFPVHRVVLAAASPYFQAMFTGGFKENGLDVVHLQETSSRGVKVILDAIYSSKLKVSNEVVEDILSVAHLFQIEDIVKACEEFLSFSKTEENCVTFLSIAEKFDLEEAADKCDEYILDNFEKIALSPEFLKLSKDKLCRYISDDRLKITQGEITVFRAATKWLEHAQRDHETGNELLRCKTTTDVVEKVRFHLIPADVLIDEVLKVPFMDENKECRDLVVEALRFHSHPFTQPLLVREKRRARGEQKLVLVSSGKRDCGYIVQENETKIHFLSKTGDLVLTEEDPVKELLFSLAYRSVTMVAIENFLFLFGVLNESFNPIALRFDTANNEWLDLKSPPCQATVGSAIARLHSGDIYLLGGMHVTPDTDSFSEEFLTGMNLRYHIGQNAWTRGSDVPRRLAYHSASSTPGFVYVAGGLIGTESSRSMAGFYVYDVTGDVWMTKSRMSTSRYSFCLEAVNDKLYAIGGTTNGEIPVQTIEVYDIHDDQWTILDSCSLMHGYMASTVVDKEQIYIIGGWIKQGHTWWYTDKVSCLNTATSVVSPMSSLPFRSAHDACSIVISPRT